MMRVAFLTNRTARVNLPVFQRLVASDELELVHAFFYDTVSEGQKSPREIIANMGVTRVFRKVGESIASRWRIGVGKWLGSESVRVKAPYELALIAGLPHSTISNVNDPTNIAALRQMKLDVLLVCVCKNILRSEVLSLPDIRFVNIHPSLLPKYRGPAPTFWMLYHGESETGVTFHVMTRRIDDGRILAQRSLPLNRKKSEVQIETEVFQLAATVLEDVMRNLDADDETRHTSQTDHGKSSYYTFPTPAERRQLRKKLLQVQPN